MSTVNGKLMVGSDRKHLTALADHLRRHQGVVVRVFDADGKLVLDPGGAECDADNTECKQLLRETCASCPEQDSTRCLTCPRGHGVRVPPIRRSSVYFGSLVACSAEQADAPAVSSAAPPGDATTDGSTGAVLDAMLDILAEESSKEHEINSLAGELALQYEELELLYDIDENIPLRTYTAKVVEYVAEKAFAAIDCCCLAWVPGPTSGPGAETDISRAECRVFWNPDSQSQHTTMPQMEAEQLARSAAQSHFRTGEPKTISNLDNDPDLGVFASELTSLMCLPIKVETDFYGYLVAFKRSNDEFTSYELKLMTALAKKSAFAIRDSRLYEDLDSLFFNLIRLLVNTIENKDHYTKGHSQRGKAFTVRLAELMGLPKQEIETLNLSGLLHDVGKQGIPDAVLKKPGKLTDEEFAMIKTHPVRGVNLIKHIKQFEKCLPHIRSHHERLDGKGYPDGLKGNHIPQGARIIAVADTYDALTSDRCYRPRFTPDGAFDIIEEVSGTQLDPDLAKLLLDNREDFTPRTTVPSSAATSAKPVAENSGRTRPS